MAIRDIRKSDMASPLFYAYILRYMAHSGFITTLAKGIRERSTGFRFNDFGELNLPLPEKTEQDRIVAFLDTKTAEIDALIQKKERQIQLLDEQKAIRINRAVTRGIVNAECGMLNEHLSTSETSIFCTHNSKFVPSGIEWIGDIPEHWEVKPLRWFCKIRSGDFVDGIHSSSVKTQTNFIPIFGGNGLMGYTHQSNSPPQTMVLGRVGALCGNVHVTSEPTWVTDNALVLAVKKPFQLAYSELALRSLDLNRLATKNAQPLITGAVIKSQNMPLPPIEEQSHIAQTVKILSKDNKVTSDKIQSQIQSLKNPPQHTHRSRCHLKN